MAIVSRAPTFVAPGRGIVVLSPSLLGPAIDADCGDAVCINERCHAGPGTCAPEVGW